MDPEETLSWLYYDELNKRRDFHPIILILQTNIPMSKKVIKTATSIIRFNKA